MWELDFQVSSGSAGPRVARLVAELLSATDSDRAYNRAGLIESIVAPPSGGLGAEVGAVVASVISGLPMMATSAARSEALFLLTHIAGSLAYAKTPSQKAAAANLVAALPVIAGFAESGGHEEQGEFVDLVSLCVPLDLSVGQRVLYYLARIVSDVGGAVGASAEREIEEVRKLLA